MSEARPKILIIDDNPDFGGHQVMAISAIEGLLRYGEWEIVAMHHAENHKNVDRWTKLQEEFGEGRIRLEVSPTSTSKFQAIRRVFQGSQIGELGRRIGEFEPSVVLVIQGNIEQGCSAFMLVGQVKCPVISYIPVPHKHTEMGAKLGAFRDWICRGLYSEPDGFITISETLARMLVDYGAGARVEIVENGIPLERFSNMPSAAEARRVLGLPEEGFLWGHVGRTEFMQKGQDFALDIFLERSRKSKGEYLALLGSGPDHQELALRIQSEPSVHCLPWTDDPAPFFSAVDALIMPSRYEGVPLAMLEALANGVPVAATDRDGMRDWLPPEWRFAYRNPEDGLRALAEVREADPLVVESLKKQVWEGHSVEDFQRAFNRVLLEWD